MKSWVYIEVEIFSQRFLGYEYDKNTMYEILWGLVNISKIKTISIKEQNANMHICNYIDDHLPLIKFLVLK